MTSGLNIIVYCIECPTNDFYTTIAEAIKGKGTLIRFVFYHQYNKKNGFHYKEWLFLIDFDLIWLAATAFLFIVSFYCQ